MALSLRERESIKIGLAMAITLAISFRMGFEEPGWGLISVAMVSLDTAGQSLNKAALRMSGTLVAGVVALAFIGLFPQARWALLGVLGIYVGVCAYMVAGPRRQYFWFVAAFVCMTIMVHAGTDSLNAFRVAVARIEETGLGILVYSGVSLFLWPHNSRGDLEAASRALFDAQHRLYRAYRGAFEGGDLAPEVQALRLQLPTLLGRVQQALAAAETDTFEVREVRGAWRGFAGHSQSLMEILGRWRVSLPEVQPLDLPRLLPGVEGFVAEIGRRFAAIESMLGGGPVAADFREVDLGRDEPALARLSHFERASVALLATQLSRLESTSRGMLHCVAEIRGSGEIELEPPEPSGSTWSLDVDRLRAALGAVTALWVAFPIWVWVDPPGHQSFWFFTTLLVLISILARQNVSALVPGYLFAVPAAGLFYVFVMPHLAGYGQLGAMFFLATAGGVWLFWAPQYRGVRAIYLANFSSLLAFENSQTYSFASFANSAAMNFLALALGFAVSYLGPSPRPEKVFLRLQARFFRQAEFLMSRLAADRPAESLWERLRALRHRGDLVVIPQKLAALAPRLDHRLLPGSDPDRVHALVAAFFDLALRIKELVDAREQVEPDPRLEELVGEFREWRLVAEARFRDWARDPAAPIGSRGDGAARLGARLARIEATLEEARSGAGAEPLPVDYARLYRFLGGFRGLSESALGFGSAATAIDWKPWREARF